MEDTWKAIVDEINALLLATGKSKKVFANELNQYLPVKKEMSPSYLVSIYRWLCKRNEPKSDVALAMARWVKDNKPKPR